ncbi:cysteine desulfurase family protein [Asaia lannensis]|uniref:Cysteine desulfurase n=1 Tax=Asaia lannensis NBRC 102526 TaxID=1307926 RepID=A0ABT1CGI1_9PROT|nr:cysteine desulfurase family protein [Asaia lannensis]MCO6159324.1 cysteine desulfurase [Asaia lannensis NBRC 102526]GBQ97551.1 cysteine desulfurase [Asaia lannensis NBRC 102526]
MIYLDNQATTRCDPAVVGAMLPWFGDYYGNPHSDSHEAGLLAARAVELAREQVAGLICAQPREIVFTSGATEANNIAIKGTVRHLARRNTTRRRVITVATEHKCVLESVRSLASEGFEPVILPVMHDGRLDPGVLAEALTVPTALVSIMAANNETGVLQDIAGLGAMVRAAGALFHSDAAQAVGKTALSCEAVDLMSISGHKIYGPKGVGALYVRHRPRVRLEPLFSGGGQERGLRSGTLPTPLIVGFGKALSLAGEMRESDETRTGALRAELLAGLQTIFPGLQVNGQDAPRVSGALNLCLPEGIEARALIAAMPDVAVSTGSACTSAEIVPSYVLTAMGLDAKDAARCLRMAVGRFTSTREIVQALDRFREAACEVYRAS